MAIVNEYVLDVHPGQWVTGLRNQPPINEPGLTWTSGQGLVFWTLRAVDLINSTVISEGLNEMLYNKPLK